MFVARAHGHLVADELCLGSDLRFADGGTQLPQFVPYPLTLSDSVASKPVSTHLHMRNPLAWHPDGRCTIAAFVVWDFLRAGETPRVRLWPEPADNRRSPS